MAISVEHIHIIERLKARIAEDAVTIAMLQAALDQAQDVTHTSDSHAGDKGVEK